MGSVNSKEERLLLQPILDTNKTLDPAHTATEPIINSEEPHEGWGGDEHHPKQHTLQDTHEPNLPKG